MRKTQFVLLMICLVCCAVGAGYGQGVASIPATSNEPVRDQAAIAVAERGLAMLGGRSLFAAIRDIRLDGTLTFGNSGEVAEFVWKDDFNNKKKPEFRRELNSSKGKKLFVSGHGRAKRKDALGSADLPAHVLIANLHPFHLPGIVLLHALDNPNYSVLSVADDSGSHVRVVLQNNIANASITAQDWYFDQQTGLPTRVDYRVPTTLNALHVQTTSYEFSDFRAISGILVPLHIRAALPAGITNNIVVTSVRINDGMQEADFDLDGGAQ